MVEREAAQRLLHQEREQARQSLAAVTARLTTPQGEGGGELTLVDQHPADAATETADRELELAQQRRLRARLEAIDGAMRRLADGSYGRCAACGRAIPDERLEALPHTPFCIEDAAREREA